mmetsp:Transcript_32988/g.50480  ORF Transcript_32988/g.50480 Transcript_32988/m.50480 type:complete len:221 (+) Transcript_32988:2451-3113(+)
MQIDGLCERIKRLNIYLRNSKTKEEDLRVKRKIYYLHKKLSALVEEYQRKYQGKSIFDAISLQENEGLYDQIVHYYITFLSMETKEVVQNKLLRFDAHLPKALRRYYSEKKKKQELQLQLQENLLTLFGEKKEPQPGKDIQTAMSKLLVPTKILSGIKTKESEEIIEKKDSSTSIRRMDSIMHKMKGIFEGASPQPKRENETDKKAKKKMLRAKTFKKAN